MRRPIGFKGTVPVQEKPIYIKVPYPVKTETIKYDDYLLDVFIEFSRREDQQLVLLAKYLKSLKTFNKKLEEIIDAKERV